VVEIVSPSDRPAVLAAKIADYRGVNVQEVWVVRAEAQTVEVVRLTLDEIETVATYGQGQAVTSLAFSNLRVPLDAIFAE
jgi:Uma2 family endonuclease